MQIMDFNQGETMSRKDYLKKKKREKAKNSLKKISKRTWFMLAFIFVTTVYVIIQFYVYDTKHRLVQTLPDEISSMKDYKIYYVSQTYTYDSGNQLKSMSTTSNEKQVINEGTGISQINVVNNSVYGIKEDGSLVKINTNGKENEVQVLVEKNVKGYTMCSNDIYVYLSGEGIETGIYYVDKNNKLVSVIKGEVLQIVVDKTNIYVVNKSKNILKYDRNGKNEKVLINDASAGSLIQDENNIYFVNIKNGNKVYRMDKSSDKIVCMSKTAKTLNNYVGMDGYSFMGVYNDEVYYINTGDSNKLYKSSTNLKNDEKIIGDSIQILYIVNGTIFYKINGDIGVYRYDIDSKISSQVTSARALEFRAE